MASDSKPYSKKMRNDLTAEYVSSILCYTKNTGIFTWQDRNDISPRGKRKTGKVAGFTRKKDGYVQIKINDAPYLAHRLAYLYVTGNWPEFEIDHKNNNRADNRWDNLRPATYIEQSRNASQRYNTSHPKGVFKQRSGKWGARIKVDKKVIYLGTRATQEEAHKLYQVAADSYFGEFARYS